MVVNVEATTDAIDYRQLKSALERCVATLGQTPKQLVADGDYANHASVQAAAENGVDSYGSWQDSWKPAEYDACGRSGEFLASAFSYDPKRDCFTCPVGKVLTRHARMDRGNGVVTHVYHAGKTACSECPLRSQCAPAGARTGWRRSVTRTEEPAATTAFKNKMATEEAQQIYAQRSQIAEFPHA